MGTKYLNLILKNLTSTNYSPVQLDGSAAPQIRFGPCSLLPCSLHSIERLSLTLSHYISSQGQPGLIVEPTSGSSSSAECPNISSAARARKVVGGRRQSVRLYVWLRVRLSVCAQHERDDDESMIEGVNRATITVLHREERLRGSSPGAAPVVGRHSVKAVQEVSSIAYKAD